MFTSWNRRCNFTLAVFGSVVLAGPSAAIAQCDPVQMAKILAFDGAEGDYFGASIGLSGDVAIIGAWGDDYHGFDSGSAYVIRRNGSWQDMQKLDAPDGDHNDNFGLSVAIDGNTAIVGADRDDDDGDASGSAYLFRENGNGQWGPIDKITAADADEGDYFGSAVAIWGDTVIIGAYGDADNGLLSGSAYIFKDDGSGRFIEVDKITPSDGGPIDFFGYSVAISGDTAIVGAWGNTENGFDAGTAYVFRDDGNGNWIEIDKLLPADGSDDDTFGFSVAMSGNTAIIGAPVEDDSGAAYIFRDDGNGQWNEIDKIKASDAQSVDKFAASVAIDGDNAVIGSWGDDDNGQSSGAAYVYRDDGNGNWIESHKIKALDGTTSDHLGIAVAVSGQTAIIGADGDDSIANEAGSAYVFDLGCNPTLTILGSCPGQMRFKAQRITPGQRVAFLYARGTGSFAIPNGNPCAGTELGLNNTVQLAAIARADANGRATLDANVPPAACDRIHLQAVDLDSCRTTNVVAITR